MMQISIWKKILVVVLIAISGNKISYCQSIHFSQYFNAPMLINPANTGLMPEYDYRLGLNYRNQWGAIPVPYNTFSGFADLKVGGNNQNKTSNNWLGVGFAYFYDKAGDGNLSFSNIQASLAYHLQMGEYTMLSLGFSGATVSRSVNYDMLTFNDQWDGFTFNAQIPNGEKLGIIQTNYVTGAAGLNFAWYPNDDVYCKFGGGVSNINQPVETFYAGTNKIGIRPTGNIDLFFHTGNTVTINPSAYYTSQKGASEIVAGTLIRFNLSGYYEEIVTQLILGGYLRVGDAVIGVVGIQYANVQFMANYDYTISTLAPYNNAYGALEFSLIYQGVYGRNKNSIKKTMGCPRFF